MLPRIRIDGLCWNVTKWWVIVNWFWGSHGSSRPVKSKKDQKIPKISQNPKNQNDSENVSLKIGPRRPGKLGPFFLTFPHEKVTLSSGQKWFLRSYFPLIRGIFLLRMVLDFRFGHQKCLDREATLHTKMATRKCFFHEEKWEKRALTFKDGIE